MYKNFLIVASKQDRAGINITTQLSQFKKMEKPSSSFSQDLEEESQNEAKFDFHLIDGTILNEDNLNLAKLERYDFIIFASKHESKRKEKTLSIHAPGNFGEAKMGGESFKACPASALFNKQCFEMLKKSCKKHDLKEYKVTMEATHHGPLIDKPCAFIEIGSSATEWASRRAGFVIAKAILDTMNSFWENPYNEIAIGIGGPHYCPSFNKLQDKSNVAISHVIPQYTEPITEEAILEAVNSTIEDIDFAVVDWKGLGRSEERQKVIDILDKNYIEWKRTTAIKR